MEQEFFSSLVKLLDAGTIERLGIPFVIIIMIMVLFYLIINNVLTREFSKLSLAIREVALQAGKPLIDKKGMLTLIDVTMESHVMKKLEITRKTLIDNHIDNPERMELIKKNIKGEFLRITQEECMRLSLFNSEIGDAGKLVMSSISWSDFFKNYFFIFQSKANIDVKLADIKNLMLNYAQEVKLAIEEAYSCKVRSFEM